MEKVISKEEIEKVIKNARSTILLILFINTLFLGYSLYTIPILKSDGLDIVAAFDVMPNLIMVLAFLLSFMLINRKPLFAILISLCTFIMIKTLMAYLFPGDFENGLFLAIIIVGSLLHSAIKIRKLNR